ncbi:MAG: UDP-N-acetylglucosamine 1-carboxyvinyltransferase [Candidatus Blackburnbacteria bacterium RIFCSPHIGHO2_02_FULL_39_13]|uniref:UDP-N-acetylglucosamine 1-carboxyvinyltransferase n=1 Tax=Candidatus Blackburnbacteria bacterium RIFCSPLOWO2_01_FULL_40_20 TaxID=1797519 RepID=A0A1G1VDH6_9BACT|nr:MAG: UDP-N-acetylglucosamine 1-carboxyvinyltransferase [Microgenomates group bacterium GW2011_GWA2_39_19]OGY06920.1 MAG: UDP-N-acetylglucosamine 1-carboxyvinyltransferase [Candidatus Blackburnbacteria bacterium RIFCSPHIGHO2_01_FULL_40_17]OGY09190.1 MAG: UDP-N-acetylglucosamine 1-carboxyvinyltransferase [Candidatus Blackburnbacteria bacterium RIFCSPHIGHO2_02_FULL_39_13]OGY13573.1 MAG: UDP-N-acetylglucosamine 1-carboxyvinyltransferase [Candidatus Blackburnbacteria bacterium RIFCSPLOWO2_01_FULL_
MAKFIIQGGVKLSGEVKVAGNKNSALKLMVASLLGDSPTTLFNVPQIRDVETMAQLIEGLGAKVTFEGEGVVKIDPTNLNSWQLDWELMGKIRASVVLAAPLVMRFGKVSLPKPGGDSVGERLIDTHISMLTAYGAKCNRDYKGYEITAEKLKPADIFLEEASVTATEMALMVASCIPGETVIEGAAAEPHIVDLAEMLIKMGAKINGAGTNTVRVLGVIKLRGVEHKVRPDHIEVGTFAVAAAITGGDVYIKDSIPEDLKIILAYLGKMGVEYEFSAKDELRIRPSELIAKQRVFKTRPWPGFPTDLISQFIVLSTQTRGIVLCHDWMYEWRIFFVDHLIKMGANIIIADPHRVIVVGPSQLHGQLIPSPDIRAGGALVLAALSGRGESVVEHAEIVDRGYEKFEERLSFLGANIKRVE